MLFHLCRSIGDFEHSDWSIFKNHWRHFRGKFIKVVVLLTTFLTLPLHPLPHCLSPSFPTLIPLHPPPHYLSILPLTTSLPPSFPSSIKCNFPKRDWSSFKDDFFLFLTKILPAAKFLPSCLVWLLVSFFLSQILLLKKSFSLLSNCFIYRLF